MEIRWRCLRRPQYGADLNDPDHVWCYHWSQSSAWMEQDVFEADPEYWARNYDEIYQCTHSESADLTFDTLKSLPEGMWKLMWIRVRDRFVEPTPDIPRWVGPVVTTLREEPLALW